MIAKSSLRQGLLPISGVFWSRYYYTPRARYEIRFCERFLIRDEVRCRQQVRFSAPDFKSTSSRCLVHILRSKEAAIQLKQTDRQTDNLAAFVARYLKHLKNPNVASGRTEKPWRVVWDSPCLPHAIYSAGKEDTVYTAGRCKSSAAAHAICIACTQSAAARTTERQFCNLVFSGNRCDQQQLHRSQAASESQQHGSTTKSSKSASSPDNPSRAGECNAVLRRTRTSRCLSTPQRNRSGHLG